MRIFFIFIGRNWRSFQSGIPATQFYNVAFDMQKPLTVYSSCQDFGTFMGAGVAPLQAPAPGERRFRRRVVRWEAAPIGGEGTHITVDPTDPTVY